MARPRIIHQFTIIISLSILIPSSNSETEAARKSLVKFMEKLSGGGANFPTGQSFGWNTTSDPCQSGWRGVKCDDTQSVMSITVSGFRFSGTLDAELLCSSLAKSFTILRLPNNSISGPIPNSIGGCTGLMILDLGHNRFSGAIPSSIPRLKDLTGLVVSNNELRGEIPEGLADVPRLGYFLAQRNNLSGSIPGFRFGAMMKRFNVSDNGLSGAIPEGIGGKFGADSFMGNPGLCGKPLLNSCPGLGPSPAPSQWSNQSGPPGVNGNGCCRVEKKWFLMVLALVYSFPLFGFF